MSNPQSDNPYAAPQVDCNPDNDQRIIVLSAPIVIVGKLEADEAKEFIRLARGEKRESHAWIWRFVVFPVLLLSALGLALGSETPVYGWISVAVVTFLAIWSEGRRRLLAQAQSKLVETSLETSYDISSEGVAAKSEVFQSQTKWHAFNGFLDSDSMILLRLNEGPFIPLARRWFSTEEDWKRLLVFLSHKLEMLTLTQH